MRSSPLPLRSIFLLPPLLFLLVFYFHPLLQILLLSHTAEFGDQPLSLAHLLEGSVYLRVIWFTFWQAALSTLLTFVLALPGAFIYARYDFRGKKVLRAASTVPFVLPTVVTAAAFRALLGANGLVNTWLMELLSLQHPPIQIEQTVAFFLLAHVFYNYTLVLRIVGEYWSRIDARAGEAAAMLGASPRQIFFRVTLPLLTPAIASSALLVFIFCFTSFGIILLLGGPGQTTIEVEIYRQAVHLFNLPMAASLSLIQILFNFGLMWLYVRIGRKSPLSFFADTLPMRTRPPRRLGEKAFLAANLIVMFLLLATPLLALITASFTDQNGFSTLYYLALFTNQSGSVFAVPAGQAICNSLFFALATTVLALVLGLSATTALSSPRIPGQALMETLILLPLATSAVTMGFGFIVTLNRPPLDLRDSLALIPLAHSLVAFPFVVRCLLPALRSIPHALREAAAVLGASPGRIWYHVDMPLTAKAIAVGAVFAFSVSMGEFGATSFIARPHTPTMPVAIFRFLSRPGDMNFGQAMAMSSILMLVTIIGFLVLEKLTPAKS